MKHRKRLQICISSETFSPGTYNGRFTLPRYNAPKYSVFFEVPLMSNILRPLPCASRLMLLFTTLCALSACTTVKSAPPTPETTDTGAAPAAAVAAPQETPAALPAAAPAASTTSKPAEAPKAPAPRMPTKSAAESVKGSPAASDYVERTDVQEYLKDISNKQGIPLEWLMNEVALARYSPLSERYTTPRPNADKKTTAEKNFLLYERNIVNAERIERGTAFLRDHQEVFARIEEESGVSRYAVAAIIGVESIYGRNMGRFRVLDALMTLSFDYTRRAKYYRSELTDFLDFCWKQQISPVSVTGSFAGAMGLGQFMPASLRAYGKDGDGDGHIDVVNSPADGIASVANYLAVHGWVRGERPLYRVSATDAIFKATGSGGIKAHTTAGALYKAGVKPLEAIPLKDDEPALLVDLPWIKSNNERGVDYYLGTGSFAAILRYNRSYFYAAAVSLLASELEDRDAQYLEAVQKRARQAIGESPAAPEADKPLEPALRPNDQQN